MACDILAAARLYTDRLEREAARHGYDDLARGGGRDRDARSRCTLPAATELELPIHRRALGSGRSRRYPERRKRERHEEQAGKLAPPHWHRVSSRGRFFHLDPPQGCRCLEFSSPRP